MYYNDEDKNDDPYFYGKMSPGEQQEYVDGAKRLAVYAARASSLDIYTSLTYLTEEYLKIKKIYDGTNKGKASKLAKEINNLINAKEIKINYGIRKVLECNCFSEYISMLEYDNKIHLGEVIETIVDNLYRQEDSINRMINNGDVDDLKTTITIPPRFKVKVSKIQICQMERAIWLEGKYPIKYMSKEKAERFLSSARKRAKETGLELLEITEKISQLKKEYYENIEQSKTDEAVAEFQSYTQQKQDFISEIDKQLRFRLKTFLESEKDCPFKKQVRTSLESAQKKTKSPTLICGDTILWLIKDFSDNKIKLKEDPCQV